MQLNKDEKAIIAGFKTMEEAERTAKALDKLNIIDVEISRMSMNLHHAEDRDKRRHNPITGDYPGLPEGTFEQNLGRDSSILAAADPSAYSMSDGSVEDVGMDVVLTVVVSSKDFDQAEKIVRTNGGKF